MARTSIPENQRRSGNSLSQKAVCFALVLGVSIALSIRISEATAPKIAAGGAHTVALKSDATLWAWGDNYFGELGDGSAINRYSPVQVGDARDWVSIAAGGEYHTVALKSDGTLWAWGCNNNGELGDGTTTWRNSPVQVGDAKDWVSIAAGHFHTMGLKSGGTLWAWGDNSFGQLGDGTTTQKNSPVQVGDARDWVSIAAGRSHTVGLKSDGTIWAWGSNYFGQLGDGTTTQRNSPVQVGDDKDWVSIAAGMYHTLALKSDETLWAWGDDTFGQLGDGTTNVFRNFPAQVGITNDWASSAAGDNHTAALKSDGALWGWGYNGLGELGDGTTTQRPFPVQVDRGKHWVAITAGHHHTVGLTSDGTLWAWGQNTLGQLGDGTTSDRWSPVPIVQLGAAAYSYPAEGTIGTKITISGWGFGAKKGMVVIENPSLGIMAALKITNNGWTDTSITGRISVPLPAGVYDVAIEPRKPLLPVTLGASFSMRKPQIESIAPMIGGNGTSVTVFGKYFGAKQGKLSLSYLGKNSITRGWECTIKKGSWTMDPETGNSEATFIVPCGLPEMVLNVSILNQIGWDLREGLFTKTKDEKACPARKGSRNVCPPHCPDRE